MHCTSTCQASASSHSLLLNLTLAVFFSYRNLQSHKKLQSKYKFHLSGDKSEVLDIDSPDLERFPEFVKSRRFECVLEPGDLLFIPGNV